MRKLELLAPAKDLKCGIAAIDCGADAVYIGAARFGARQAVGNSIDDINELCEYAHKLLKDENVDFKIKEKVANELFDKIIYNKDENTLYVYFKEH